MVGFFRSVAEAVVEAGVRGLLEEVPFGRYFCDVAERVVEKERARHQLGQLRAEFESILALTPDAARDEAHSAVVAAARERGVSLPAAEVGAVVEWIAGIPEAARVSNRRPDDPSGRTLRAAFALDTPAEVLKVLPPRPPRFLPGQPVPGRDGEWVLERVLGVGGFGEVWLARHAQGYHPSRAVKFFFDETGRDVEREAGLVKRAMDASRGDTGRDDDPRRHIVPILDVRLTGATPWLMFEYVGGGNLAGWLMKTARTPPAERLPQVFAALQQLSRGVSLFHALPTPLTHRDLKPSNILVDPVSRRLRITDFGIGAVTQRAANAREQGGQTSRGEREVSYLRGAHTPLYSSPQQRRGESPDPRDDVHALGVIGYQLLVGRLDESPGPRAAKQLEKLGVRRDLIEILLDSASENPADRPADAVALSARLDALGKRPRPGAAPPVEEVAPVMADLAAPRPEPKAPTQASGSDATASRDLGVRPEKSRFLPPTPLLVLGGVLLIGCLFGGALMVGAITWPTTTTTPTVFREKPVAVPAEVDVVRVRPVNPKAGDRYTVSVGDPATDLTLCWIPPGSFTMGCDDAKASPLEWPAHTVPIPTGFWMGQTEVTQTQWQAVMKTVNVRFKGPQRPVDGRNWTECQEWCKTASAAPNAAGRFRLPTEAEWEYACRAGTTTTYNVGDDLPTSAANYYPNFDMDALARGVSTQQTKDVASYPPNPWGLYDMHANVAEWCEDEFKLYPGNPAINPALPLGWRVARGGSLTDQAWSCRTTSRAGNLMIANGVGDGFRVCLVPK